MLALLTEIGAGGRTVTRFDGKVAVITGAGGGIGFAFAQALAQKGASIAVLDVDADAASRSAVALQKAGATAVAIPCDVASEEQAERALGDVSSRFGGVDILINNAGKHLTRYNQPFAVLPRHELRSLFDVNVFGIVNCSVAALPKMIQRGGGRIVNIASIASDLVRSPYGVSKLAVRGLTAALAAEFAPHGILVNAISPGVMASAAVLDDMSETLLADVVQRQLIKRRGEIQDLVGALLYLCSEHASFVTGETIRVSGGYPLTL